MTRDRQNYYRPLTGNRGQALQICGYFGDHDNGDGRKATPLETTSSLKQQKLMLKTSLLTLA